MRFDDRFCGWLQATAPKGYFVEPSTPESIAVDTPYWCAPGTRLRLYIHYAGDHPEAWYVTDSGGWLWAISQISLDGEIRVYVRGRENLWYGIQALAGLLARLS